MPTPNPKNAVESLAFRKRSLAQSVLRRLFRRPVADVFHRVIARANERGIINAEQMHEICGIFNRMFMGYGPY